MENLLVIAIMTVILASAARYVWRARKRGVKCIGCPGGGCCSQSRSSGGEACSHTGGCPGGGCDCCGHPK